VAGSQHQHRTLVLSAPSRGWGSRCAGGIIRVHLLRLSVRQGIHAATLKSDASSKVVGWPARCVGAKFTGRGRGRVHSGAIFMVAPEPAAWHGGRGQSMGVHTPSRENAGCAAWASGSFRSAPRTKSRLVAVAVQHLSVPCDVPFVGITLPLVGWGVARISHFV
jgi:hypothetical protein